MQSILWRQPGIEPILLPCSLSYQVTVDFPKPLRRRFSKEKIQQTKELALDKCRESVLGENSREVIDTLCIFIQ